MTASVSGLGAQGQAISVISDNLANTNTIGYKAGRSLFSQLVTNSGANGTAYNSGGVNTHVGRDQTSQGSFITSTSTTDLAISGNGFFKVADDKTNDSSTSFYYTRAGSFSENKEGYLTNPDGYYLQGWKTDANGTILNVQNPVAIELQSVGVSSQRTTSLSVRANLNSTESINTIYGSTPVPATIKDALDKVLADPTRADYVTDIRVYDAQGSARDLTVAFTKRGSNDWDWQVYTDGSNVQGGTAGVNTRVSGGTMQFTTTGALKSMYTTMDASGNLATPIVGGRMTAVWSGGVDPSTVDLNFGDFTGGPVVSATSGSLSFDAGTPSPVINGTTIAGMTSGTTTGALADGTYTLRRIDATHVAIYDAANSTLVDDNGGAGYLVATTGAQTMALAGSGVSLVMGAGFDMTAVANGGSVGTFTTSTVATGGTEAIAVENQNSPMVGTYTVTATANGTFQLSGPGITTETATTIGANGTREIYFPNNNVRITVSDAFDESAGTTAYPAVVGTFTVTPQAPLDKGLGTDGITQLAANYNTGGVIQNGFGAGTLSGISVDSDGFVVGTFTNGETKKLYKVALAVFQDPNALELVSGSLLRPTDASGNALLKEAGVGGTGTIVGGSLEGSTTDIAGEFSNMIVAQRAFQASSKVITTVDQMLNDLLQLR
jgi:flagellar hook protein FlgE